MKQRALTHTQLTVIQMRMAGNNNSSIAAVIGVHPDTVSNKYCDILKGIAKGAYNNLPMEMRVTGDLFEHADE